MFHPRARAGYDVALGMYHDQVLVPVKTFKGEPEFGKFSPDAPVHASYAAILKRAIEEPFVLLVK